MPPRVYRGRCAFEFRGRNGVYVTLCPLNSTPRQVWDCYLDVVEGDGLLQRQDRIPPMRYREIFVRTKRSAQHRGVEFTLTEDSFDAMVQRAGGRCELSRIPFTDSRRVAGARRAPYAPSVDRIDCKKGYTPENTRLLCLAVNLAINDFGERTLMTIARRLVSENTVVFGTISSGESGR